MSKSDAQRAMREANYARNNAKGASRREAAVSGETPAEPAARKTSPELAEAAQATSSAPTAPEDRCGHKSMNGRACTREAGHPEKSHRYG